jgi:hypothetical protein
MQISTRFVEHGLIGGFFWSTEIALILVSGNGPLVLQSLLDFAETLPAIPDSFQPLTTSLLGGLAIVLVFTTGLILDLASSFFIVWEMRVFRMHLERNREWIEKFFEVHKEYGGKDYAAFITRFTTIREEVFPFWRRQYRHLLLRDFKDPLHRVKLIPAYNRLWNLLFSYLFMSSGQTSVLVDQIYLWRACRSIATGVYFIFLEVLLSPNLLEKLRPLYIVAFLFPLVVIVATVWVVSSGYSRLCTSLFALVYAAAAREHTPL